MQALSTERRICRMSPGTAPLLERQKIFHSRDAEQTRAFLRGLSDWSIAAALFKPNCYVTVELPTKAGGLGKARLMRVKHLRVQPGNQWWILGGQFLTKLTNYTGKITYQMTSKDKFIGYIQYGAPVTVRATPARDDYWIQLPVHGCIETTTGHACVACDAQHAAVCAPMQENVLRSAAGCCTSRRTSSNARTRCCGSRTRWPASRSC